MDQLRSLRVFYSVIGEGSFAGAARALDMAPAGVTRCVSELEEHLGARLLNRTTRRIALTEIGEAYLESAKQILEKLDDADALAGAATAQPQGKLRVLCPPAFAVHQLARHLPKFRAEFPQISLELSAPGPVDVAGDHFDVSILSLGQQTLSGEFVARKLATSAFIVCAAPSYLLGKQRPKSPQDLLHHAAVLPATAAVKRDLTLYRTDAVPGKNNSSAETVSLPTPALSTHSIEMIFATAVAGLGIAGLPSFIAEQALRDGRLERLLPQWCGLSLTLYAAVPARKQMPKRSRVFIDFLVKTFGGSDSDPWINATST
jgi:DNA-binding transcriptional LysR family regulator